MKNQTIIATLVEGDFIAGAVALFNSLIKNGFEGHYVIGVREGDNPPATISKQIELFRESNLWPTIQFIECSTSWHFTNYKAQFLCDCLDQWPEFETAIYLDPDIIVTCPSAFLENWSHKGVAMAADVNWWMPSSHPVRLEWIKMLKTDGFTINHNELNLYCNGGFFGASRSVAPSFLKLWNDLIKRFGGIDNPLEGRGDIDVWRKPGRWQTMYCSDQDAFNMAAMVTEHTISQVGPDAMGFVPGDLFLAHAVGGSKPWRRNFIREVLQGHPPRTVDKLYWSNVQGPIRICSMSSIKKKQFAIRLASLIGRFYARR
ncbi:MAG: hypothetical protein AB3N63_12945 [Puniceicoccaceae bacterium]